jgi:hypothetical protein
VSIDLLNASSIAPNPILENIAHNLNSTELGVNVTWPFNIPNETATYQLYFIAAASGSDIATSGNFNLTLLPGENRTQAGGTVGPYGTHPNTDLLPSASARASVRLSKGAIAGTVVGAVGAVALCLGVLVAAFLIYRGRHHISGDGESDEMRKSELDGSSPNEKRDTLESISSAEIGSSDKPPNYLRFELPSSPPKTPVELPDNEIPAFEMSTGADMPTRPELDDAVLGDHGNIEIADCTEQKPISQTNASTSSLKDDQNAVRPPHSRNLSTGSLSTTGARPLSPNSLPNSPSSGSLRSTSHPSSSPRKPMNFMKALEEIVAEEFRRKDPE